MTTGVRLKQVREMMGLTQTEFGDRLGFKLSKIRDMEIDKQKVTPEIALDIESKFSISFRWLLTGKGSMTAESVSDNGQYQKAAPELDPVTAKIIAMLGDLPDKKRLEVLKEVEDMKEHEELKAALQRLGHLDLKTLKQAGCITLNLLYVLAFPPMIILSMVGYHLVNGPTAVQLFSKLYLLYIPVLASVFVFHRQWFHFLKSRYVSFVNFTNIGPSRFSK